MGRQQTTATRPLTRFSGQTVEEALEVLGACGRLGEHGINLISLEPIATRLGPRWERRRDDFWRHVEPFLRRHFRPEDLILRLDDLHVLVAQPGRDLLPARISCVRAAAELMRFFVGEEETAAASVKVVDAVEDGHVYTTPLPRGQVQAMLLAGAAETGRPARVRSTPVLTRLGRSVSVTVSLEPLLVLRPAPRTVGHQVRVTLSDGADGCALTAAERSELQPSELADIDVAVLTNALAARAASPKLMGSLIVPVSHRALSNSSSRYYILQEVQRLTASARNSFGWEIVDLEGGVPAGRLAEIVAIAKSHCRGVICRLDISAATAAKVGAAGATLSIPPPELPYLELALSRLERRIEVALRSIRALMLHDIPADLLPVAALIGATHCTVLPRGDKDA